MSQRSHLRKVAFVGNYAPRKCGIATFTHDLRNAVGEQYPETECVVVPVTDLEEGYDYPEEVRFEIAERDLEAYRRAADYLNFSDVDVVSLQHEFGIFGGPAGSHVLTLLRDLRMPVVTTLHTVLTEPSRDQRRVMTELIKLSSQLVVMSEKGRSILEESWQVPGEKIQVVPHGIPDMPFVDPNFYKDQYGVEGKHVLLTFGLLGPGKGIENVIQALPAIAREVPNLVYIVLGATHPNLVRAEGESYRRRLERMAEDLGVKRHITFYNRFVDLDELKQFIGAADIYLTPYLNPAQITSGTLAYSFGCGKAVVSTPYWHAEELLADGRGVLVPFNDPDAIAREVVALLLDEPRRHAMRKRAYLLGREMVWGHAAHRYMDVFQVARRSRPVELARPRAVRTLDEDKVGLPQLRLDHLERMTDDTGMLQHARYTVPLYREGYCLDDNARALILTVLLEELDSRSPEVERLSGIYAAFVQHAFDEERGRFRNFMGFDRRWLEDDGSDDANGRALWALGTCVGRSRRRGTQFWSAQLFDRAVGSIEASGYPRTWAFALLGVHEYLRRLDGARRVMALRDRLTARLVERYERTATDDWRWFEDRLSYANARLPHALIVSGRAAGDPKALEIGLTSLRWLSQQQRAKAGHFLPIGSEGFYPRGGERARFDQQPIEAHAMTSACIAAYRATEDPFWLQEARVAFEWFLGRNDLGQPVYDASTGGCHDGLQEDRLNQNQGAESTLSFLLALTELRLLESELAAFREPAEADPRPTSYLGAGLEATDAA